MAFLKCNYLIICQDLFSCVKDYYLFCDMVRKDEVLIFPWLTWVRDFRMFIKKKKALETLKSYN
jgi:hypothetical protein